MKDFETVYLAMLYIAGTCLLLALVLGSLTQSPIITWAMIIIAIQLTVSAVIINCISQAVLHLKIQSI